MMIEQLFVLPLVCAAGLAGLWWIRREQRLAGSYVEFVSSLMSRELLERRVHVSIVPAMFE